ncbi:MAG: class I SAM-dependent methyltransferase [Candidatus Hadarchaeia archaeon]
MTEPKNLKEALKDELTQDELKELGSSFDIVGDIAVLKLSDKLLPKKERIGEALMDVHGNISTVLRQTGPVSGEFRTRELEVIAGEERTETEYTEYGCTYKVDLAKAYFSPRLARERYRIAEKVEEGEIITNMFAGVGCYSIMIAKHGNPEKVYSIDKNPSAFDYMKKNVRINKVGDMVLPIKGDSRAAIEEHLEESSDRVLMPLPEFARDFLGYALKALKQDGGVVHFYDYGEKPDLFRPTLDFVREQVSDWRVELNDRSVVRSYAPNLYHVVLDLVFRPNDD